MKIWKIVVLLAPMFLFGTLRAMDDKPETAPKAADATAPADATKAADAAKPADAAKAADPVKTTDTAKATDTAKSDAAAGTEETKTGSLAAKAADAKPEVIALLQVAKLNKKGKIKKKKNAAPESTLSLTATGDLVQQIKDLTARNAQVQVSGIITGDTMKVLKVSEVKKKGKNKPV